MMKKVLTAAVTAALFGIASVSWAQGAGGAGGAGGGTAGAGSSGGAGGGGASPSSSSTVPGGGSAGATTGTTIGGSTTSATPAPDAASGSNVPSQCFGTTGAERERCVNDNRGRAGVGSSQTPTHPGDAAKSDNRYNSPATGTGAHSVPR